MPILSKITGPPTVDLGVGLTVYRIVQESLANVLRHAEGASQVVVEVTWVTDGATIVVRDNGAVVRLAERAVVREGGGIIGMGERAALFGGIAEADPHVDGAWQVCVQLQWERTS